MTIYDRIKALRIAKGLSQADLAKLVGYEGRSAISKVENGTRDISQSMIEKYAEALGTTPTYLLYGDEDEGETPLTNEAVFAALFSQLSAEHQNIIIAQIKGILATYDKKDSGKDSE